MNRKHDTKVSTKLTLSFSVIVALLVAVCVLSVLRIGAINQRVDTIRAQVADSDLIQNIWRAESDSARFQRNGVILAAKDLPASAKLFDEADKRAAAVDGFMQKLEGTPSSPKAVGLLAAVKEARGRFAPLRDECTKLARSGKLDEATAYLFSTMRPANKAYFDALDALGAEHSATIEDSARGVGVEGHRAVLTTIGFSSAAALICVLLGWKIGRSVYADMGGEPAAVVAVANAVAAGELTVDIKVRPGDKHSVLAAMSTMRDHLANLLRQVRDSSQSVALGSKEIANGNADLSQRTEIQAGNLQQAVGSMSQLTTMLESSRDTAERADHLAMGATNAASRGGELVAQVVATMDQIASSSRQIADITGVIDGIAFQTNILALNAAVEAARAGEQGRGFAVVAGEVRSLAQRSALAAREIKTLIATSVEQVELGARSVNSAGTSMGDIVAQVQSVSVLIGEISSATREQSQSIGQVGDAIEQLEQMTQQNAALVEQSAAAADSLREQSERLANLVEVFKLAEAGAGLTLA